MCRKLLSLIKLQNLAGMLWSLRRRPDDSCHAHQIRRLAQQSPRALAGRLRRAQSFLRALGIDIVQS